MKQLTNEVLTKDQVNNLYEIMINHKYDRKIEYFDILKGWYKSLEGNIYEGYIIAQNYEDFENKRSYSDLYFMEITKKKISENKYKINYHKLIPIERKIDISKGDIINHLKDCINSNYNNYGTYRTSEGKTIRFTRPIFEYEQISPLQFYMKENILPITELLQLIENGYINSSIIGKVVPIFNHLCENKNWIIIDINHDGTKNTVDLISETVALKYGLFDYNSNKYNNSRIKNEIEGLLNGFAPIVRDHLTTMNIISNGETIKSKIKLPSVTELNFPSPSEYIIDAEDEGEPYPLLKYIINNSIELFPYCTTRSRDIQNDNKVYIARITEITRMDYKSSCIIKPIIRLS